MKVNADGSLDFHDEITAERYPGYNPNNVDYSLKDPTATDAFDFNLFQDPRKSIDRATANNIFYNDLASQGLTLPNYKSSNIPVNTKPITGHDSVQPDISNIPPASSGGLGSFGTYTSPSGETIGVNEDAYNALHGTEGYGGSLTKNSNALGYTDPNSITGFEIGQLGLGSANTIMSALALPGQLDYMKNLNENTRLKNEGLKAKINDYEAYRTKAKKNGLIS